MARRNHSRRRSEVRQTVPSRASTARRRIIIPMDTSETSPNAKSPRSNRVAKRHVEAQRKQELKEGVEECLQQEDILLTREYSRIFPFCNKRMFSCPK